MSQQLIQQYKMSDILQSCINLGYKRIVGEFHDGMGGHCALGAITEYERTFGIIYNDIDMAQHLFQSHYNEAISVYNDRTNADWEGLVEKLRAIGQ